MKLKVTKRLNDNQHIEECYNGKDFVHAVEKANPLLAFDGKCQKCGNPDFSIQPTGTEQKYRNHLTLQCSNCGSVIKLPIKSGGRMPSVEVSSNMAEE